MAVELRGGCEPHTTAASQARRLVEGGQRGKEVMEMEGGKEGGRWVLVVVGAPWQRSTPRRNNGRDNDTGGGISVAPPPFTSYHRHTHTQISPPVPHSALKSAR